MSSASDGYKVVDDNTHSNLVIKGGTYIALCHAASYGTVSVNILAADGATWVPTGVSFSADGYQETILPPGQIQIANSGASGVAFSIYRASYD